MTKKILIGMLILFVATALQSQQPAKRYQIDSVKSESKSEPVMPQKPEPASVDSNEILKSQISVVNTDIYKTADRIDYKIGKLPALIQRVVRYNNRLTPEVFSIQPPKLPVVVQQRSIDSIPAPVHQSKFLRIFKRRN